MLPVGVLMVRKLVPLKVTTPLHADHPVDEPGLQFCCKFQPVTFSQNTVIAPADVLIDKGGAPATWVPEPTEAGALMANSLLVALVSPEADTVIV